jgi:hypothetical protein
MDAFGTANNAMTCRLDGGRPVPCDKLFREAGAGGISKINVSTIGGLGGVGGNTGAVMGVLVNSATSINGEKLRYNPDYNPDLDDPGPKYLPVDFSPLALLGQQGEIGNWRITTPDRAFFAQVAQQPCANNRITTQLPAAGSGYNTYGARNGQYGAAGTCRIWQPLGM